MLKKISTLILLIPTFAYSQESFVLTSKFDINFELQYKNGMYSTFDNGIKHKSNFKIEPYYKLKEKKYEYILRDFVNEEEQKEVVDNTVSVSFLKDGSGQFHLSWKENYLINKTINSGLSYLHTASQLKSELSKEKLKNINKNSLEYITIKEKIENSDSFINLTKDFHAGAYKSIKVFSNNYGHKEKYPSIKKEINEKYNISYYSKNKNIISNFDNDNKLTYLQVPFTDSFLEEKYYSELAFMRILYSFGFLPFWNIYTSTFEERYPLTYKNSKNTKLIKNLECYKKQNSENLSCSLIFENKYLFTLPNVEDIPKYYAPKFMIEENIIK